MGINADLIKSELLEEARTYFGDLLDDLEQLSDVKARDFSRRVILMYGNAVLENDELFLQSAPGVLQGLARSYGVKLKAAAAQAFHERALILVRLALKLAPALL